MSSEAFNSAGWSGYFEITSDATVIDEALGSAFYDLSQAPASFWAAVKSDGGDIRVTNSAGTTAYSFEVGVDFSVASEIGSLFFDSSLMSAASNVTWRIYAGNSGASMPAVTDTLGARNVYTGEIARWHLDEDPTGSAPQFTNSVTASNNLTANGTMTAGDSVDGVVGNAVDFDGSNDYLGGGSGTDLNLTNAITVAATVSSAGAPAADAVIAGKGSYATAGYHLGHAGTAGTDDHKIFAHIRSGVSSAFAVSTTTFNDSVKRRVVMTYDGSNVRIYVNGAQENSTAKTGNVNASGTDFEIGRRPGSTTYFSGTIDEVVVDDTVWSANKIATEYDNLHNNAAFWTTGAWTLAANRRLMLLGVGT